MIRAITPCQDEHCLLREKRERANLSQRQLAAKVGAEYVLRMLPVGTHDWNAFITPAELATMLRSVGLRVGATTGLVASPFTAQWKTGRDMATNYMMVGIQ